MAPNKKSSLNCIQLIVPFDVCDHQTTAGISWPDLLDSMEIILCFFFIYIWMDPAWVKWERFCCCCCCCKCKIHTIDCGCGTGTQTMQEINIILSFVLVVLLVTVVAVTFVARQWLRLEERSSSWGDVFFCISGQQNGLLWYFYETFWMGRVYNYNFGNNSSPARRECDTF